MINEQKKRLVPISEEVWRNLVKKADSLLINSPPVHLEEYAKEIGITDVQFRPLISDAGLARNGDSLQVVVNTEHPGVKLPTEKTASVGDGSWRKFQPSLRFTIAHEIAHGFFMRAAKKAKEDDLLEDKANRTDVEEACKTLARLMLLPRRMIIREIGEKLLNVDHLSKLIAEFDVSPEVFLRRFHLSDLSRHHSKLDGFLAFISERNDGRLYIKACHVFGTYARDRFNRALPKAKINKYLGLSISYRQTIWNLQGMMVNAMKLDKIKDIESILRSTEGGEFDLDVEWGDGGVIPCNLAFRRIRQKPVGFLIRLQVVGPLQKPGQRTLF